MCESSDTALAHAQTPVSRPGSGQCTEVSEGAVHSDHHVSDVSRQLTCLQAVRVVRRDLHRVGLPGLQFHVKHRAHADDHLRHSLSS